MGTKNHGAHGQGKLGAKDLPATEAGFITSWQVSSAFEETNLAGVTKLGGKDLKNLTWNYLETEFTGTLNVARLALKDGKKNTVLVKRKINSDKNQIKRIDFGFSDKVSAYVNNNLIYTGSNIFGSRDYRNLGTIGFFDSLYMPLKKGDNEVIFALTENFGGWA